MPSESQPEKWHVYIIRCSDNSLYTGITTDMERRFQQHLTGRGAKYFAGRKPLQVIFLEKGHSRASASRRENTIKALSRAEKDRIVDKNCCEKLDI